MAISKKLKAWKPAFTLSAGLTYILLLGILDLAARTEISFAAFYALPVCLVAWHAGFSSGLIASVVCTLTWSSVDYLGRQVPTSVATTLWNGLNQLFLLLVISSLLARLKETLEHERALARRDPLTGAANKRAFTEKVEEEIARAQRHPHPVTLAYIDLDHFKAVNDAGVHSEGDRLLQTIVSVIQNELRRSDLLGGDEFALLLPETGYEAARLVIDRIRELILSEMQSTNYPITLSIGVLTCDVLPERIDALMGRVDALMYSVKRKGKDGIQHKKVTDLRP